MLTREELMTAGAAPKWEDVPTPAGVVRIAVMDGVERHTWDTCVSKSLEANTLDDDMPKLRATLVCLTATGDDGKRLFTLDDVETVSHWQAPILWPLHEAAWSINRLGVKALEEDAKN